MSDIGAARVWPSFLCFWWLLAVGLSAFSSSHLRPSLVLLVLSCLSERMCVSVCVRGLSRVSLKYFITNMIYSDRSFLLQGISWRHCVDVRPLFLGNFFPFFEEWHQQYWFFPFNFFDCYEIKRLINNVNIEINSPHKENKK